AFSHPSEPADRKAAGRFRFLHLVEDRRQPLLHPSRHLVGHMRGGRGGLYREHAKTSLMNPGGIVMRYGKNAGKGTLSVWGGEERVFADNTTPVPLFLGVVQAYEDLDEWRDVSLGKKPGHIYVRITNPTVHVFEEKV